MLFFSPNSRPFFNDVFNADLAIACQWQPSTTPSALTTTSLPASKLSLATRSPSSTSVGNRCTLQKGTYQLNHGVCDSELKCNMCRHPRLGFSILVVPCRKSFKIKMCKDELKGMSLIPQPNVWCSVWPRLIDDCTKVIHHITPCLPTNWILISQAHHCLQKVTLMFLVESPH